MYEADAHFRRGNRGEYDTDDSYDKYYKYDSGGFTSDYTRSTDSLVTMSSSSDDSSSSSSESKVDSDTYHTTTSGERHYTNADIDDGDFGDDERSETSKKDDASVGMDFVSCDDLHFPSNTEFDELLYYEPVISNLIRYLDVESLKNLSETSYSWRSATDEVIGNRCKIRCDELDNMQLSRRYTDVRCPLDRTNMAQPGAVEKMTVYESRVSPSYLEPYTSLEILKLYGCKVQSGDYPRVKTLRIEGCTCCRKCTYEFNKPCFHDVQRVEFIYKNYFPVENILNDMRLPNLTELHVDVPGWWSVLCVAKLWNLKTLYIDCQYDREHNKFDLLVPLLNRMVGLESLTLAAFVTEEIHLLNISNLHTFAFVHSYAAVHSLIDFVTWLAPSTKLKSLSLDFIKFRCCGWDGARGVHLVPYAQQQYPNLEELLVKCEHVEKFEFYRGPPVTFPNLKRFVLGDNNICLTSLLAPKLEELAIVPVCWDKELDHIVEHFPNLTKFGNIEMAWLQGPPMMAKFLEKMKRCSHFEFSYIRPHRASYCTRRYLKKRWKKIGKIVDCYEYSNNIYKRPEKGARVVNSDGWRFMLFNLEGPDTHSPKCCNLKKKRSFW